MKRETKLIILCCYCVCAFAQNTSTELWLKLKYPYSKVIFVEKTGQYYVSHYGRAGICNVNGEIIIDLSLKNKYITPYYNGYEIIDPKKHPRFVDTTGREIIQSTANYTRIYPYYVYGGGYVICNKKKKGYCDENGKEIIPPIYTRVDKQYSGFEVKKNKKMGWLDKNGKEIIPPKYDSVSDYIINNWYVVEIGKKKGILNHEGKEVIPVKYDNISFGIYDDLVYTEIGDKKGVWDEKGNEIISANKYTKISPYNYRYFYVWIGEKKGVWDKKNKELISCQYDDVNIINVDIIGERKIFVYTLYNKEGILDSFGNKITDAIYDKISYFGETLIACNNNQKWGYVSVKDGSIVIPFEYDAVSEFHDGVARVSKDGKEMLIPNPLKVVADNSNNQPKVKGKAVSTYPAPNSDVDMNIPKGKKANENTFAFIIANENYPMAKVPYALNDGWIFEQYCKTTLGIKDENVKIFEDATGGNIYACIEQIKQIATAYEGDANILFYYAGHAFPDEDKNTAYLLPIDGDSKNIKTGYSLEKLYNELNSVKTKSVVCFIDACFSGATREDTILLAGRGVAIKVKEDVPQGNIVVFTSATGAETAHQYEEKGHGLFTYYLLQKLQETKGDVTLGDLAKHIIKMVRINSVLINHKQQTPTVIPSISLSQSWKNIKL